MPSLKKSTAITGKNYWRSLNQLDDNAEFRKFVEGEFPAEAAALSDPFSRRRFLSLMGASLALAGLAGCRRPVEKIIPFVTGIEDRVPGMPEIFATTMTYGQEVLGVLVENHDGRPTKIEGNPQHPATRGSANAFVQSAILDLYDPDRSQSVLHDGAAGSWDDFAAFWGTELAKFDQSSGAGLAILAESMPAPTLVRLKQALLTRLPKARWVHYEPVSNENIFQGLTMVTGRSLQPRYNFAGAQVVLGLESDFLHQDTDNIINTRGFSAARRVNSQRDTMNRLYVAESGFTVTGGMADHRLSMPASHVGAFAVAVARELVRQGLRLPAQLTLPEVDLDFNRKWLVVLAKDLLASRGRSVIVAGRNQPPEVHALVHLLNAALGNVGKTVLYYPVSEHIASSTSGLQELVAALNGGQVETMVILGGNPVYNASADLNFPAALDKAATTIHFSTHVDETSSAANWHIPRTHFLEEWGDAQSIEGTLSIIQPQISPLFGAISPAEMLALLAGGSPSSAYDEVRTTWSKILPAARFEKRWRKVLHDGLLPDSGTKPVIPASPPGGLKKLAAATAFRPPVVDRDAPEIVLTSSASTFDGRFANNGWLQELPDPITKLVWDNAAVMNRRTAEAYGWSNNTLITVVHKGRVLTVPIWIIPGRADYSIAIELGFGRERSGRIGTGVGQNAYALRTTADGCLLTSATLRRVQGIHELVSTQDHHGLDLEVLAAGAIAKRLPVLIREATLDEYRKKPDFASEMVDHPPLVSLWEERAYDEGYQWGMTIDLNVCTGCNACSIACQSENNIPVIGKREVGRGREMSWLRMDRYFSGTEEEPEMVYQPLACQHCEMAPCEQVCPVAATTHDKEGMNVMTYNRCIGTRYCSNNCPYKVRRFNFFNYTKDLPEIVQMVMNPDVTVRSRGVMEKCTFCIQRVSLAKISAKQEDRLVHDQEVQSACQQSCPAEAIVFGNINDPDSRVSKIKQNNRNYALLGELNLKPRTTYLAKLRNPNPELMS